MIKHEIKACPRCGSDFECKTGSIALCQCQTVSLDHGQSVYVAERYEDCLCAACLAALRSEYNHKRFTQRLAQLLNGHH